MTDSRDNAQVVAFGDHPDSWASRAAEEGVGDGGGLNWSPSMNSWYIAAPVISAVQGLEGAIIKGSVHERPTASDH